MNKLGMQAQFVPIISFGISCSFKESDTLDHIVQGSNGIGTRVEILQCFLKGPPTQACHTWSFNLLKIPTAEKKKLDFFCFCNRISMVTLLSWTPSPPPHISVPQNKLLTSIANVQSILPFCVCLIMAFTICQFTHKLLPCGQCCNHMVHYVLLLQMIMEHIAGTDCDWNQALPARQGN